MSRYASGKYAKGVSDRSGRAYPLRRMLIEWNGMLVGPDEYESKQPQLAPKRVRADPEALRVSRPARTEPEVAAVLLIPISATVGNLSGGGGVSSAGPVTLPALPVVDLGNGYIT